jgi:hypothetical protein
MRCLLTAAILFLLSSNLSAQDYSEVSWMFSDSIKAGGKFGKCMDFDSIYGVVGSPGNERAYVLKKVNNKWTQVATLKASDGKPGQGFGNAVAIQGSTVVVGAPYDVSGISNIGAAYVYTMPANGWQNMTQNAKLVSAKRTAEDRFGQSVSVYGNIVVVGAFQYSSATHRDCGRAFIFEKPVNGWANMTETAYLSASDESTSQHFAQGIDIYKNIVVVGDGAMSIYSAAYLFEKPSAGWANITEKAKLTPTGDQTAFGKAIDIYEDEIVIGSSDAAFVFVKPSSGWQSMKETASLTNSDGIYGDDFGISVSIQNRYILIGAPRSWFKKYDGGKAYLFEKPAGGWRNTSETTRLYASNEQDFGELGSAVALTGNDILVGAWKYSSAGYADCGAMYVYDHYFGPQDMMLSNNIIKECSNIGDTIGRFSTIDGNMYDKHICSLVQGNGINDSDNGSFFIRNDTLFNKANLDYEKKKTYNIYLEVSDTSNLKYKEAFTINIKNIAPIINDTIFYVPKLAPLGTLAGILNCKGDTNSIKFELVYTYGVPFKVDTFKAAVLVSNSAKMDPSLYPYFDLTIEANDDYYSDKAIVRVYPSGSTSIPNSTIENLRFYPNPTKGTIYFDLLGKEMPHLIEVYNVNGVNIYKSHDFNSKTLDLDFLSPGFYFIKIDNQTFRIVKE